MSIEKSNCKIGIYDDRIWIVRRNVLKTVHQSNRNQSNNCTPLNKRKKEKIFIGTVHVESVNAFQKGQQLKLNVEWL